MLGFHLAILIIAPIAALVAIIVLPKRVPTLIQFLIGLISTFLIVEVGTGYVHGCHEGTPQFQWRLPGAMLLLALTFIKPLKWRLAVATAISIAMFWLYSSGMHLAHESGWTANPRFDGDSKPPLLTVIKAVEYAMDDPNYTSNSPPAGWLRELPIWNVITTDSEAGPPPRRVIGQAWHSWLSGLYPYTNVAQDYWYPGGKIKEAGGKIELRDRINTLTSMSEGNTDRH